jgi:energy-coupling factor transporter transmembrane protein EcfT
MNSLTWWIWSLALTISALRTQNIAFYILVILIYAFVVKLRKNQDTYGDSFKLALQLAAVALVIRLIFGVIIGTPLPGNIWLTLPQLHMPDWLAGIRIGGPIAQQRIISVFTESITFALILLAFGAASSLSSPMKLIKMISGRIYLFGVTLIIATSVMPQIVQSFRRVLAARRMRGLQKLSISNFRSVITPVLEESLERALELSISMESRGFGQRVKPTRYRAEKIGVKDLGVMAISLYLLLFLPILVRSLGFLASALVLLIFSSAPLLLTYRKVIIK